MPGIAQVVTISPTARCRPGAVVMSRTPSPGWSWPLRSRIDCAEDLQAGADRQGVRAVCSGRGVGGCGGVSHCAANSWAVSSPPPSRYTSSPAGGVVSAVMTRISAGMPRQRARCGEHGGVAGVGVGAEDVGYQQADPDR